MRYDKVSDSVLHIGHIQGLYSLNERTSYRKISRSLEAARFGFRLFQFLWNMTGTSAGVAAEMPVRFQSDMIILTSNLSASRLTVRRISA